MEKDDTKQTRGPSIEDSEVREIMEDKDTDVEEDGRPIVSDKQARITEIAIQIFTGRCAQNTELKAYSDLFISNEEKQILRDEEVKAQAYQEQIYQKAQREYDEYNRQLDQQEEDAFIFDPVELEPIEQILRVEEQRIQEYYDQQKKKEYWCGAAGVATPVDFNYPSYERELMEMREKLNKARFKPTRLPGIKSTLPKTWRGTAHAPTRPLQGPNYDELSKTRLDELAKTMNKEIEMSYFLARLFVDRRLKVLK